MISFLGKVAQHIKDNYATNTANLCVVLPNKRAALFLKKELIKTFGKTIWSPHILSQDDFIQELCNAKIISSFELNLHFYSVYKKIENNEEKDDLNEFLNWAPSLLNDFDAIDRHLINTSKFFQYVNESRALEVWNVDGQPLSDFQKKYLHFWKNMHVYYTALNDSLVSENKVTRGLAYRIAAQNASSPNFISTWHKVIFAGLNALSPAEELIVKNAIKCKWGETLWDCDEYYLHNKKQEAGTFLRRYLNSWNSADFLWKENLIQAEEKNIYVISCPQNMVQAKVAGDIIKNKFPRNSSDSAVILCDENQLLPLLNYLPNTCTSVNITMGFPIKQSDIFPLLVHFFSLHDNALAKANNYLFYHKDLLLFLSHSKTQLLLNEKEIESFKNWIVNNNKVYITCEKCISFLGEKHAYLFSKESKNGKVFLQNTLALLLNLKQLYNEENDIEKEYLFAFYTFLQKLNTLASSYIIDELLELKTLRKVFLKLIRQEKLSFYGEPLQGMQILGMLESRALDFENILLLSVNEGVLPQNKQQHSFVPFDIKKEFGLHTHQENDAIFSYHFYRLLQHAKNIYLLHTSVSDAVGMQGEKSRFIKQLEVELQQNKNAKVNFHSLHASLPMFTETKKETSISSSANIIKRLYELNSKSFSPSAINKLIVCPLDFYYRYILGLGEAEEVEEKIESNSLGTAIHATLEKLYRPFLGKIIQATDIQQMHILVESYLKNAFEHEKISELEHGKNHLSFTVAVDVINRFLHKEKSFVEKLKSENQYLTIVSLETKMESEIEIVINGKTEKIKIGGTADRIDKIGNEVRLIDYKTGSVRPADLSINNETLLKTDKSKAFQLLWYSTLYLDTHPEVSSVHPAILSFKALSQGLLPLKYNKTESINREIITEFKNEISSLFTQLFEGKIEFIHRHEAEYCEYC